MRAKCLGVLSVGTTIFVLLTGQAPETAWAEEESDLEKVGDVLQIALPAGAFLSTFFVGGSDGKMWDREGTKQSLFSIGSTLGTVYLLKEVVSKMRPNGRASNSYPSGHTAAAFSGAAFINERYGWHWGVPSYALALLTGYSRVESEWHFADDVVAGASIAMIYSWVFVTPHHSRVTVAPSYSEGEVGVQVGVDGLDGGQDTPKSDLAGWSEWNDKFRFDFGTGPAFLVTNEITSPADGGTTFDLNDFQKNNDPLTTAAVNFNVFLKKRNVITFFFQPFSSLDRGAFSEPTVFGGEVFPDSTSILSGWRLQDLRARWRNGIISKRKWEIAVGAGLMLQDVYVSLEVEETGQTQAVEDIVLLPYLSADVRYKFSPHWVVSLDGDGLILPEDRMIDGGLYVTYLLNREWSFTGGYRYYGRDIETDEIVNRVIYQTPYVNISHSWF